MKKLFSLALLLVLSLPLLASKDGLEFNKYGVRIKLVRAKGDARVMTRQGELFLYQRVQERKFRLLESGISANELLPKIKRSTFFVVRAPKAEYYFSTSGLALGTFIDDLGEKRVYRISLGDLDLNHLLGSYRDQWNDLSCPETNYFVYNLRGDGVRFNVFINGNMIFTNTDNQDYTSFNAALPINRFLKIGENSVKIGIFDSKNGSSGLQMSIVDIYNGGKAIIPEGALPLSKEWIDFSFDLPPGTCLEVEE